ncbi:hypothetical protein L3Q82_001984 [Scortum barcoo]|uniref:Uncharacterized protein n=1 Tax=Scortum barcoo TaxID=214431 RepID=A0ACB8W2K5_9TELE|nr:hypothetical protein L3Q82_001984 [Scortum barcoo]
MALASGHWLEKEMKGEAPSPRYGHALAVAGNVAFLFGGASSINQEEDSPVYFKDFYMLTVSPDDVTWEEIPQSGEVPSAREGHTLCVVKGKLYLFGGVSRPDATECLPGVYSFDIVGGVALRTIRHSSVAMGDNIYVYGGLVGRNPTDDLLVFNTVSLTWMPVKTSGSLPPALYGHSFALVGDQVFLFGGHESGGDLCKDLHVLNTAKMKWKVPLYVGIPPGRRHGHTTFILHSHLYVFGGKNEEQEFNDLKVMKLINPSERQPVMKEILSEFGLQGVSHSFTPTKVPNIRYELSESPPSNHSRNTAANAQVVFVHRDFSAVRDQAMKMIQTAFTLLDQEFQKLDRFVVFGLFTYVQQAINELQEMLDRHRSQNEAWLRARAEENDRDRRELCRLRVHTFLQSDQTFDANFQYLTLFSGLLQVPVNPSLYLIKYDGFDCVYGLELHKDERVQGLEVLPDRLAKSRLTDVNLADTMIGKAVEHMFETEEGPKEEWRGMVLARAPIMTTWFYITYEKDPVLYMYQLLDDYKEGDLRIMPDSNDSVPAEREPGEVVDSLVGKQVEYAKEDGGKRTGMVIHQVEAKPSVYFIKFDDDFLIYVYDLVKTS